MTVLLDITADDVVHSWWIPEARRQDGRRPRLLEQDVVPDPAGRDPGGPEAGGLHGPVRRALRPQPRQHVRPRDRHADGGLQEVVRRQGPGGQGRPGPGVAEQQKALEPSSRRPVRGPTGERATRRMQRVPAPADHRPTRRARSRRLDLVDHHDRSQEDRDHVPRHGAGVLRAGRGRGAADAHAAGDPGQHAAHAGAVQPDPHHARHDDDLPGRRAGVGGLRELPAAADDRGARRRLPAPERVVVLDVPVRRPRAVRVDVLLAARGRLVLLRAAQPQAVLGAPTARRRGSTWSTSPA